jgi:hypothetical protein
MSSPIKSRDSSSEPCPIHRVSTLGEFFEAINRPPEYLGPGPYWYRGHESSKFTLTPSLLRHSNGIEKEPELYDKYLQTNVKELPRRSNSWETVFDMQHYGVPTRLLDWTEVVGVAMYFAFSLQSDDPCIYVLNPQRLTEKAERGSVVKVPSDDSFDYKSVYLEKRPPVHRYPLPILPMCPNDRITRQRGRFTVHGSSTDPLEDQCPNTVFKIMFSRKARTKASEFLETANLTAHSLFPDFVGMVQFIRNDAKLEPGFPDASILARKLRDRMERGRRAMRDRPRH